jgi:hypothetical protein
MSRKKIAFFRVEKIRMLRHALGKKVRDFIDFFKCPKYCVCVGVPVNAYFSKVKKIKLKHPTSSFTLAKIDQIRLIKVHELLGIS